MISNLFRMTPAMLHSIDHTGRIEEVSDLWLAKLGYAREDVIGRKSLEFLTHASARYAREVVLPQFWETGSCDVEYEMQHKDGSAIPVRLRGLAVRDENGMFVRSIASLEDLSERRALERKMLETQKLESLGLMAGNVAHDFNNFLVSIVGNAQLVMNRVKDQPGTRTCLSDILTASERAADLCRQLLAYSGRGRFQVQETPINQLISEMAQVLEVNVGKSTTLALELAESDPVVLVDATQIRQIVMNLVLNAAESLGGRNGTISITTSITRLGDETIATTPHPDASPGEYVVIEVTDTGPGMPSEVMQQIFDPFFSTKGTGRGLGLAAVHGIVRGHHGTLQVESEPGRGTRFTIYLPWIAMAAMVPTKPELVDPVSSVSPGRQRPTVLVIDDDDLIRNTLKRQLAESAYDVTVAASGKEALELVERGAVVTTFLIDVTMPDMSGPEVASQLHALRPDARIVMMSGYDNVEVGASDYMSFLLKPFTEDELIRALEGDPRA